MLQVATFRVPDEQDQANEFLSVHKPAGTVNFNRDTIIVFYDDGKITPQIIAEEWREYIHGARRQRYEMEIALHVGEAELADLTGCGKTLHNGSWG